MKEIINYLALLLILSVTESQAAGLSEQLSRDVHHQPVELSSQDRLVLRGKTFVNSGTIIGRDGEANMVQIKAPKVLFERNRVFNRGRLVVPPSQRDCVTSLVRYLPHQGRSSIKSEGNHFINNGSLTNK